MTELYVAHSFITAMANIPLCLEDEKEQKTVSKEKEKLDLEFWFWLRFSQQTFILKLKICSPFCPRYKNKNLLEYKIIILAFKINFKFSVIKYIPFFENSFSQILWFDYKRI